MRVKEQKSRIQLSCKQETILLKFVYTLGCV